MKRYSLIMALALVPVHAEEQKKSTVVSTVNGVVNNTYAVVQTTIYRNPHQDSGFNAVTRAMLDTIAPGKAKTKPLEVKLEVPQSPVTLQTYGATKIAGKIGELVGAVGGPKGKIASVAVKSASMLADLSVTIAEGELTKLYENQEYRINLLEILPTKYYRIDTSTHKVEVTDDFINDFEKYTELMASYLKAFVSYRKYEKVYAQMYTKMQAIDPSGNKNPDGWKIVNDYHTKEVAPRLDKKNKLEDQFSEFFPMYRMAIMASPSQASNTCGKYGKGPWELYIIYYLGAKQTNQIAVKFCVPNPKDFQTIDLDVVTNSIQVINSKYKQQQFNPGGLKIKVKSNASVAQTFGLEEGNFAAQQTEVFNWFIEMVTNPMDASIENFLVPFDVLKVRQEYAQKLQEKQDEKTKEIVDTLDEVIKTSHELSHHSEEDETMITTAISELIYMPTKTAVVKKYAYPEYSSTNHQIDEATTHESTQTWEEANEESNLQQPQPSAPAMEEDAMSAPTRKEWAKVKADSSGYRTRNLGF
jgi:hypothetical protein